MLMRNTIVFSQLMLAVSVVLFTGCSSVLPVQSNGELLSSLSRVTEGDNACRYSFGGDNGKNLFIVVEDKSSNYSNIYVKESPFSASMTQKTGGNNYHMAPTYSPVTRRVAFSALQEGAYNRDIYMVDAVQSNALIQITNTPNEDENFPSLSQDGSMIVYEKISNGNTRDCQIWIKNLKTNEEKVLGPGRMPSLSPDGRTIAFVKYTDDAKNTCLWTMNIDGSNQVQVTYAKNDVVWHPRFSPDGTQILFQCAPKRTKKNYDLYVIDRNGNNQTQLTINKSYDGEPYWANDGNIYFTSDRGAQSGRYQIWRFNYGKGTSSNVSSPQYSNSYQTPVSTPVQQYGSSYHEVSQGETISQIAQKYGVTVRDIVKWNGLQTMTLTRGMKLKVSAQ